MKPNGPSEFWSRVNKTPTCWLWTGRLRSDGYAHFRVQGRWVFVHRYSFILHKHEPRSFVLHTCDVRHCVNPAHLYDGGHQQNVDDRETRQRGAKGSAVGTSRLTEDQVLEMRETYALGGVTQADLMERYGMSAGAVSYALKGKTWRHLP